jgi:hypothetical protein
MNNKGGRMREVLVLLLIVGILLGTFAVIEGMSEEYFSVEHTVFSGNEGLEDNPGDPAPCGGEGGGGGSAPG